MASNSCSDVLQHPEILDREDLLQILQNRSIPLQEIENLDKEKLFFLFYKYVSPLPQRLHQLRRAKRETPKSPKTETISSLIVLQNTSRKRVSDINNQVPKVKIPKSDLEHVLINGGSSKSKQQQTSHNCQIKLTSQSEVSPSSKSKANSEVKSKPVKLNRKSLNLELNSNTPYVNRKSSYVDREECRSHNQQNDSQEASQESSNSSLDDVSLTKKKFKKIAISWP